MEPTASLEGLVRRIARQEAEAVVEEKVTGTARRAFNLTETADMLGVDPKTVRRYIEQGHIRSLPRISKNYIIPATEIDRFLTP